MTASVSSSVKLGTVVLDVLGRNDLETLHEGERVGTEVRLDVADDEVRATRDAPLRLGEHRVRLPDPGA